MQSLLNHQDIFTNTLYQLTTQIDADRKAKNYRVMLLTSQIDQFKNENFCLQQKERFQSTQYTVLEEQFRHLFDSIGALKVTKFIEEKHK